MSDEQPFVLSIETDAGTYRHGFHLGTDEPLARNFAEKAFHHHRPRIGTRIVTVALMHMDRIFDVYDGDKWFNDLAVAPTTRSNPDKHRASGRKRR